MRVLLIWPNNDRSILSNALSCCEPLPLEYLAGALKAHHDVIIHDLRIDPPLETLADREPPGLIGLAIPYTTIVHSAHEIAKQVKRIWPTVPLVIGGHHPSVSSNWLNAFPADYIIVGEGGDVLCHLVEQLERGGKVEFVPGLAPFSRALEVAVPHKTFSLDTGPLPDRSLLRHHQERYFHSIYSPVSLVRFSAGCPYSCSFCVLWKMTDRHYFTKSIPRIISELEQIRVDNVYVVDDEAFIQPHRMHQLADAIKEASIHKRFHMYVRADTAINNPDVLAHWAEIGLDSVLVGAESMSDAELRSYRKGANANQNRQAVRLFHELGVKVRTNFIVTPDYDESDFLRLEETVQELGIDLPTFSVLTPLPGTELFEQTRHLFIADNPDLFDCYHTLLQTKLPLKQFYEAFARLFQFASARSMPADAAQKLGNVFYYSNKGAFEQMLEGIRNGYLMYDGLSDNYQ